MEDKDKKLEGLTSGSGTKVLWKCEKGHEWVATVNDRTGGHGCPYCSGRKSNQFNCLATLNPELAKEWHTTKNGTLTPNDVTCGSNKKPWWICKNGHEWEDSICHRSSGVGCPYCSGHRVCSDNSLRVLNSELSAQWHTTKNGNLTPNDITKSSMKKVWWICSKNHEWEDTVAHRNSGRNCPFCDGKRICDDNCLSTVNPQLAAEWHPTKNGNLKPIDVTKGSNKKVWWICDKGHEWECVIPSRTYSKSGCPQCAKENRRKVK